MWACIARFYRRLSWVVVVLLSIVLPVNAQSDDVSPLLRPPILYVAPDGNDSLDCLAPERRCATLQRALALAPAGAEIRLASGVYAGPVRLKRPVLIAGGFTAPDFAPSGEPTVLDGLRRGTTVVIDKVEWARLSHLTITGGLGDSKESMAGRGGGLFVRSASVTLDSVVVRENVADNGGSGRGGGIYLSDAELEVLRSSIISNTAALVSPFAKDKKATVIGRGGGIFAQSARVRLWQSEVAYNRAASVLPEVQRPTRAWGGGLYAEQSTIRIEDSRLLENEAVAESGSGGGLRLLDSWTSIHDSELSENVAISSGRVPGRGGAMEVQNGTTTLLNVRMQHNQAVEGGGIRLDIKPDVLTNTTALTITNALMVDHPSAALWLKPSALAIRTVIRHTTLVSNSVGVLVGAGHTVELRNSVLVRQGVAVQAEKGSVAELHFVNRYANEVDALGEVVLGTDGDLALPPGFALGDPSFRLSPESLLLDRGELLADIPTDFEGQPRSVDGDGDGIAAPDLGWDEAVRSAAMFGPDALLWAQPSQQVTITLQLRNIGLAADTFQLRASAPSGWQVQVDPQQVELGPRRLVPVTVSVWVPATAPLNSRVVIPVWAVGQTSTSMMRIVIDVVAL